MKPLDNRFSPRGGFSSSQWNHIENVNDANIVDTLHQNNFFSGDLDVNQNQSRRDLQKFRCGLLT